MTKKEFQQEEFISSILDSVQMLNEKANRKDYKPTIRERKTFEMIYTIITNMKNWF